MPHSCSYHKSATKVVKEIRLNGKYELEAHLAETTMEDDHTPEQEVQMIDAEIASVLCKAGDSKSDQSDNLESEDGANGAAALTTGSSSIGTEEEDGVLITIGAPETMAEVLRLTSQQAVHLLPQPMRKLGRPVKAKVPLATSADTPLQHFLDECFDVTGPDSKTPVAHVRARHRLWRNSHVIRDETTKMVEFFRQRFDVVKDMDEERDMMCSFYKGLTMRPWVPPCPAPSDVSNPDVDAFVQEACEVHVMGRARMTDLWDAFVTWKHEHEHEYTPMAGDRVRFISHLKTLFVYHTGVPVTKDAPGMPGV